MGITLGFVALFWNISVALQTHLVCSHRHQLPRAAPFLPPHAQHSPLALRKHSLHSLPYLMPTDRPTPWSDRQEGWQAAGSTNAGHEGPPPWQLLPRGAHFTAVEVPAMGKEFSMDWSSIYTTKLLPCFQTKRSHLRMEIVYLSIKFNWSGNSSWCFQICQYASCLQRCLERNMQKFNISKEKQQQDKLWMGIIKKDNKKKKCIKLNRK